MLKTITRTGLSVALGAAAVFALGTSAAMAAVSPGDAAPELSFTDSTGKSHSFADFKGKKVVLEWTNRECPYVEKHYETGNMQALQKEATGAGDVVWLTVLSSAPGKQGHLDAAEANTHFTETGAAPTAVILDEDGALGKAFGAKTTPHMYVIDADGMVAYAGAIDSNPSWKPETVEGATNYVMNAVASLRDGETPDPASTRAYGCSVKY